MTKKILTAIVTFVLSVTMAMAQDITATNDIGQTQTQPVTHEREITGIIIDKEEKEPVIQATVQLYKAADSTYVAGAVSDIDGNFSLQAPENGKYYIKITNIGYKGVTRNVTISDNKSFAFGKII